MTAESGFDMNDREAEGRSRHAQQCIGAGTPNCSYSTALSSWS